MCLDLYKQSHVNCFLGLTSGGIQGESSSTRNDQTTYPPTAPSASVTSASSAKSAPVETQSTSAPGRPSTATYDRPKPSTSSVTTQSPVSSSTLPSSITTTPSRTEAPSTTRGGGISSGGSSSSRGSSISGSLISTQSVTAASSPDAVTHTDTDSSLSPTSESRSNSRAQDSVPTVHSEHVTIQHTPSQVSSESPRGAGPLVSSEDVTMTSPLTTVTTTVSTVSDDIQTTEVITDDPGQGDYFKIKPFP